MSKPEDISQEAWDAGAIWAAEYAQWLHAGNSTGSLSPDAVRGLTDQIARAILAEREECAKLADVRVVGGYYHGSPEWADGPEIAAAIRQRGEVNTAHKNSEG